jgi:hypothetical protein
MLVCLFPDPLSIAAVMGLSLLPVLVVSYIHSYMCDYSGIVYVKPKLRILHAHALLLSPYLWVSFLNPLLQLADKLLWKILICVQYMHIFILLLLWSLWFSDICHFRQWCRINFSGKSMHKADIISNQVCKNFKCLGPSQNSRCQRGDTELGTYWGYTNIRQHHKKFCHHNNLAPGSCPSLPSLTQWWWEWCSP